MSKITRKIEILCEGKEYSTHQENDTQQIERIEKSGVEHLIIDGIILEWLDKNFPIPTKESIIATEIPSEEKTNDDDVHEPKI